MKIYLLTILVCLSFVMKASSENKGEILKKISKQFREHLEYNSKNKDGNYFIYFDDKFASSPKTNFLSPDWLKEDPLGVTPYAEHIRRELNKYNALTFRDPSFGNYVGKLQHYFIVVSLDLYDQVDLPELQNEIAEKHVKFEDVDKIKSFKDLVALEIQNQCNATNTASLFETPHWKISLLFVGKKIVDNHLSAEYKFTYLKSTSESYPKLAEYAQEGYKAMENIEGFGKLITSLDLWIIKFFKGLPAEMTCPELGLQVNSTIAQEFITDRCMDLTAPHLNLKQDALLKNARFIDLLFYLQNKYPSSEFATQQIGDIQANWVPFADYFFDLYIDSESTIEFDFWLRDKFGFGFPSAPSPVPNRPIIESMYYESFFIMFQPSATWLASDMIDGLNQYFKVHTNEEIEISTYNPITRYHFYKNFSNTFKWLDEGLYDEYENVWVFANLKNYSGIKVILMEYILNKSLWDDFASIFGTNVTPTYIAGNIAKCQAIAENINQSTVPFVIENAIPAGFSESFINSKTSVNLGLISTLKYYLGDLKFTFNSSYSSFDFHLDLCEFVYVAGYSSPYSFSSNQCLNPIASSMPKHKDFWDWSYTIILNDPTYIGNDVNCNGQNCHATVGLEPAYFTVTKVREKKYDQMVEDVSLAVSLATLPLSWVEFAAATGAARIMHGVWLASDVTDVLFTVGGTEIESGFKKVFGNDKGQVYYDNVSLINNLVSLTSAAELFTTSKKTMEDVAGIQEHANKFKEVIGDELIPSDLPSGTTFNYTGQLKQASEVASDLFQRSLGSVQASDLMNASLFNVSRLHGTEILNQEYDNLRKLIYTARHKVNNSNLYKDIGQVIDQISSSSADIQRLVSDLDSYSGLIDLLTPLDNGARSALKTEMRLNAWKYIDEANFVDEAIMMCD